MVGQYQVRRKWRCWWNMTCWRMLECGSFASEGRLTIHQAARMLVQWLQGMQGNQHNEAAGSCMGREQACSMCRQR